MFLKRKRSNYEVSAPISSPLKLSTAPYTPQIAPDITSHHLSSRTRKRVRGNRPNDDVVHNNTLNLLFQAQRQPPPDPMVHTSLLTIRMAPTPKRQSSISSFFSVPSTSRPSSSHYLESHQPSSNRSLILSSGLATPPVDAIHCFSCDSVLVDDAGDKIDMDVDMEAGWSGYECAQCRKAVCGACSISHLGQERRCLGCAERKSWVGGLGWVLA